MTKKRQSFTRQQVEYKLNERTDTLIELPDRTDMQELINSHHDETLYYNLERYFVDSVSVLPPVDDSIEEDVDIGGSKADKMLHALERVQTLRLKYSIPDYYSDIEVLQYLRAKAAESVSNDTTTDSNEGGENNETNETQTVQES